MSDLRPTAVFDSGVGGLSVLRELRRLMPNESFIYLGDTKNAPYGEKSHAEICRIAEENAKFLFGMGAKALVIACNTATAAAIEPLRNAYPGVPVVGIEPAIKPAVEAGKKRILVLATPVTVREARFIALINARRGSAEVIPVPCDGLAGMVERGETSGKSADEYFDCLFSPYRSRGFDAVVLGCTHYPFAYEAIHRAAGDGVVIFDGAVGTARHTRCRLSEVGLDSPADRTGNLTFICSDGGRHIEEFYRKNCLS